MEGFALVIASQKVHDEAGGKKSVVHDFLVVVQMGSQFEKLPQKLDQLRALHLAFHYLKHSHGYGVC